MVPHCCREAYSFLRIYSKKGEKISFSLNFDKNSAKIAVRLQNYQSLPTMVGKHLGATCQPKKCHKGEKPSSCWRNIQFLTLGPKANVIAHQFWFFPWASPWIAWEFWPGFLYAPSCRRRNATKKGVHLESRSSFGGIYSKIHEKPVFSAYFWNKFPKYY